MLGARETRSEGAPKDEATKARSKGEAAEEGVVGLSGRPWRPWSMLYYVVWSFPPGDRQISSDPSVASPGPLTGPRKPFITPPGPHNFTFHK